MTLADYVFPCSYCSAGDHPLRWLWLTACDRALCVSCGMRAAVVVPILRGAGIYLYDYDAHVQEHTAPLTSAILSQEGWEEEETP